MIALYCLAGAFVVVLAAFVWYFNQKPNLQIWHTADLSEEFVAGSDASFAAYLAREERLFAQLADNVLDRVAHDEQERFNRYDRGSPSDPARWPRDWNRTFELPVATPAAGVLLLHGLTDSPYSLRPLGERLHAAGSWVVGLRLPGHGTAPSGLAGVHRRDWVAAVRLAMQHLRERVGERPIHIVGYSNGGALAVHYAISAVRDETLPRPQNLVLLSPEIGISRIAGLLIWLERLGRWLGLHKLQWASVLPEYDPFKYQSFAVNAGDQAYRFTGEIAKDLRALQSRGKMDRFPRVLAFQSAVDATVKVADLITVLMRRFVANDSELVIFDLNRTTDLKHLLENDPKRHLASLLDTGDLPFVLSVVTNVQETSPEVVVRTRRSGESAVTDTALGLTWPDDLFSLAHIALPFPPGDPLYGGDPEPSPGISIGKMVLYGEKGVLRVPAANMLRAHWNPFYPYLERRVLEFTGF